MPMAFPGNKAGTTAVFQGGPVGVHRRAVRAGGEGTGGHGRKGDRNDEAARYLAEAAKMEKVIYRHGWDGAWFVRAYHDFGKPIGSKTCKEGEIFIESHLPAAP
jgi:hypothetical protein